MFVYAHALRVKEYFETKQWYRKYKGGSWYLICDFETGEDYWSQTIPDCWIGAVAIMDEEHYEIQ